MGHLCCELMDPKTNDENILGHVGTSLVHDLAAHPESQQIGIEMRFQQGLPDVLLHMFIYFHKALGSDKYMIHLLPRSIQVEVVNLRALLLSCQHRVTWDQATWNEFPQCRLCDTKDPSPQSSE